MARWLLIWASLIISSASLVLGIANWLSGHEQIIQAAKSYEQAKEQSAVVKAQFQSAFRPLINFDTQYDPDRQPFGVAIVNRGKGPALIKSVTYWFDHSPYRFAADAVKAAKLNYDHLDSPDTDDALGAGEKEWLLVMPKRYASAKKAEPGDFALFIASDLAIEIEFCSLAGECMKKCSGPSLCTAVAKP
jgi:hypothetical protein